MIKKIALGAAAVAVASSVVFAGSHVDPAIAGAIKARQSHMSLYGHNLGLLGAMAKAEIDYDSAAASGAAANILALASMSQARYWPQGSDNAGNEGTRALPALWQNMADAGAKGAALVEAAAAMNAAAGVDLASLQGAMSGLGGACGACHKAYRQPPPQ